MLPLIISSLTVMFASLAGVISVWRKAGAIIEKNLHYLVSFSAGVFIIIAFGLSKETVEHIGVMIGIIWIILGALISFIIFSILPHFHHHEDSHEGHNHSPIDARRILLSDAVHNIADGILLAASYGVSITLGLLTTVSIFVHELIQEISEFFVLRQAGFSVKQALWSNLLASSTILIGAVGGYFLLDTFEIVEAPILGLTAGAFLVVIFHDLIPHSLRSTSESHTGRHIAWFIIGTILMTFVNFLISDAH